MLQNYLKIAVRNLLKHKAYSLINVVGLAGGMACCILILIYINDELSYDRFHTHAERIYRVVASNSQDGQPTNANGGFSPGPALAQDFAEVEQSVRFRKMGWGEKRVFARDGNRFYEQRFFFVDANVFEVFDFPFLTGEPSTALTEPQTLVLTEEMARKYFPNSDPMGQSLSLDPHNDGDFTDFKITGVLHNIPANSHIKFDFLMSFSSLRGNPSGWGWDPVFTYLLLSEDANRDLLESKLPAFQENYMGPDPWYSLSLQPLIDIRLHSHLKAELEPNGDIAYVYTFSAIAFFVLLIACINFMNLATARSAKRAREVGLRKVMGAYRVQLIRQFLGEAVLLSIVSIFLAILLVEFLLPVLNSIVGKEMTVSYLDNLGFVGGMAVFALLVGIMAGSYPAFFMSAVSPVDAFKQKVSGVRKGEVSLRKGLVVFQFTISVALIICTVIVYEQMHYVRTINLGFAKEQIVVLPLNEEVRKNYRVARNELIKNPNILNVAVSEQVPARAGNGAQYLFEGQAERESIHRLFVDHHFLETYGIEMAAGRDFSEQIASDSTRAFVLNETQAKSFNKETLEDVIGMAVSMRYAGNEWHGTVIGVAKDFNLFSLRRQVTPVVLSILPMEYMSFVSIRMVPTRVSETLTYLQETWQRFSPSYPIDYYFLDNDFERLHRTDQQLGQLFNCFASLAILIACLGLFGLAAFTAEQRTKEIGIRKVLGASVTGVFSLLSREFAKWVLFANLLAWPIAYHYMNSWLQQFTFRIGIEWYIFAISALAALLIAGLSVSLQTVKAALTNPVNALHYE